MARGHLRVYLGAAPGVGKTYAMLGEGHRRLERGTRVIVAFVEDHGRQHTRALLEGMEVVPRTVLEHRGTVLEEMDLAAVLARHPEVALVDELAHTNVPGVGHAKRWEDVETLLDAGIDVITTVNVQHLESLNDTVAAITGTRQNETVPDRIVRAADQIELVDMSPEALRRRLAHGNVYAPGKVDAALSNYFRVGNLTALRELALLWVADRVEEGLERYRAQHGINSPWPARERVVVALTGGPEGDTLIRRGARIAGQAAGGELLAVHVVADDGLVGTDPTVLTSQRVLVESLGGSFRTVVGNDVAQALLATARGVNATQLVVGVSRRRGWQRILGSGVGERVVRGSGDIDVHMVTHDAASKGVGRRPPRPLTRKRVTSGWVLGIVGPLLLVAALRPLRDNISLASDLLLFLALAVGVALVGGRWPAVADAVFGSLLLNWFFTPPFGTLTIDKPENAFSLLVFVLVAVSVASVVDQAARQSQQASRARAEAAVLSTLAGGVLNAPDGLTELLEHLRSTFGLTSVTVLQRPETGGPWEQVEGVGWPPCPVPEQADVVLKVSPTLMLALRGRPLGADDQRLITAYAATVGAVLERDRLARDAAEAHQLAAGNAVRTALLAAVSHDLRTPLAGIKAAVSSLRMDDVRWTPEDEAALLETIEESADRLDALLSNLLDMSRLQTGAVRPRAEDTSADDLVARGLAGVSSAASPSGQAVGGHPRIVVQVDDNLPVVRTDAGLVERALANLVENALRHTSDTPVLVTASAVADRLEIRVIDSGRGIPDSAKTAMFAPFQRLGDVPNGAGVGLGLAVARGLTEAVGGSLEAEDTPGGGLTMVLSLPTSGAKQATLTGASP
jgi:two-component system, OmpR family, sensor histidine kinase KdpD